MRARRRYSAEEKKAILAEASAPGATVTEVSHRHNITRGLIHNWRREEAGSLLGATVRFAPVTMTPSTPEALEAPEKAETSGRIAAQMPGRIEIELPGGVRVRVEGIVDEEGLKRVLRALRR